MFNNRKKFHFVTTCCWLSLLSLLARCNVQALSIQKTHTNENDIGHGELIGNGNGNALQSDATVRNFSPRLEYNNEWRPVGRGDPLKNDPTYDYSPPALERVRYWRADNESKDESINPKPHNKKDYAANSKKEILLLGKPAERQRGQTMHGETSVLQPKYTSIRRSYYAHQHQLPTHLMPPPMQTLAPSAYSMKSNVATEYRHSMPSSTTTMTMMHTKPYYSTSSASSPWMHTSMSSMPTPISSSPALMMQQYRQQANTPHMPFDHDHHHHQETINHFTYTRPNQATSFTPNNFIDSNQSSLKPRKPWLHELLQKEVVKVPPKTAVHKYSTSFEQMTPSPSVGISTTHPPVAFVPLPTTMPQTTTSTTTQIYTTTSPIYFTTTMSTTTTKPTVPHISTPSPSTSNRLLIPTTSNLVHRPTVTPMEMTTDALFKHYKQPAKPLLGPMYLIIEGHSKVKTYGKDELDPHRPKIVPIIPKREPVVRVADPNEKRGTLETFQVKHLHTKATTPFVVETTQATKKPIKTTTTTAPLTTTKATKPTMAKDSKADVTTTTTKSITTTTTETPTTKETTKLNSQPPATEPPTGMEGFFSFLDSSLGNLFQEAPTASEIREAATLNSPQDNLIFVTTTPVATILHPVTTTTTAKPPQIEARIGTHGSSIESLIDFEDEEINDEKITTEPVPRDVRQVFDYDQLPESRLKDRMDVNSDEGNDDNDNTDSNEEGVIALNDNSFEDIDMEEIENLAPDEYDDGNHEMIKRIDKLVDDIDDDGNEEAEFEELISAEVDDDDDILESRRTKET